jgi:hypothetical protein
VAAVGVRGIQRRVMQHRGGAVATGHRRRRTPWPPRSTSVQCLVCVVATPSVEVSESCVVVLVLSVGA